MALENFYSTSNEAVLVQKQLRQGAEANSVNLYLHNSLDRFIEEFVINQDIVKISYQIEGGCFKYPGIVEPILETYRKTAARCGTDSREEVEAWGFEKIQSRLIQDEANMAFWISPPSFGAPGFGDYGFLFVFVKRNPEFVDEYILRYDREDQNLSQSRRIFTSLLPSCALSDEDCWFVNEKDFLSKPLFLSAADTTRTFEYIAGDLGFVSTDEFNGVVDRIKQDPLIRTWTDEYTGLMLRGAVDEANGYLKAVYNRAKDLKDMKTPPVGLIPDPRVFIYYSTRNPVVDTGSCPVPFNNRNYDPIREDINRIMSESEGVLDYRTATLLTSKKKVHCTCPFCGKKVDAEVYDGKIHCPNIDCKKAVEYKC